MEDSIKSVILGNQTTTCQFIAETCSGIGVLLKGFYPKGMSTVEVEQFANAEFQELNTNSFKKSNQKNMDICDGLVFITSDQNLEKEDDVLLKLAEVERKDVLLVDTKATLSATISKLHFWFTENKVNNVFIKSSGDVQLDERFNEIIVDIAQLCKGN